MCIWRTNCWPPLYGLGERHTDRTFCCCRSHTANWASVARDTYAQSDEGSHSRCMVGICKRCTDRWPSLCCRDWHCTGDKLVWSMLHTQCFWRPWPEGWLDTWYRLCRGTSDIPSAACFWHATPPSTAEVYRNPMRMVDMHRVYTRSQAWHLRAKVYKSY